MITLKVIVDALRDISIQDQNKYPEHLQIKSFGFGPLSLIDEKEIDGVVMWVVPTTHDINGNLITYRFSINILDLVDENNNEDVINDTALIYHDIIKKLSSKSFKKNYGFRIESISSFETVQYKFSQNCSGQYGEIEIVTNGTCRTAFIDSTNPTPPIIIYKHYLYNTEDWNIISISGNDITIDTSHSTPTLIIGDYIAIGDGDEFAEYFEVTNIQSGYRDSLIITVATTPISNTYQTLFVLNTFTSDSNINEYIVDTPIISDYKYEFPISSRPSPGEFQQGDYIKITTVSGDEYYDIINVVFSDKYGNISGIQPFIKIFEAVKINKVNITI